MKQLTSVVAIFILITGVMQTGFAQQEKNSKDATYEIKDSSMTDKEAVTEIIEQRMFVLEANFLTDKYGNSSYVSPTINFIKVDSSQAVIQIGSNLQSGYNGVGGITAKGHISDWKVSEDKNHIFVRTSVMTSMGLYDINMDITPGSQARATISGLRGGRLSFTGNLIPLHTSSVYEGRPSY